ncbi:MAG: hypothetical protein ACRETL_07905 [Gammaproteobacteria bacterium]
MIGRSSRLGEVGRVAARNESRFPKGIIVMENSRILRKSRVPHPDTGVLATEVEIACSLCDGSKVVIVPDIELPNFEERALEDVRCRECEDLVA